MWKSFLNAQDRLRDRAEAGQMLAARLAAYARRPDVLVLGLPRGGVAVAYEVAVALDAPLDVFLVRKLGVPGYEELAMGAIASGGARVLNDEVVKELEIPDGIIELVVAQEQKELLRRERLFRKEKPPLDARGRAVIIVDDGLATGATMREAVMALRCHQPARIIVAVPVGTAEACADLLPLVDELVCLFKPEPFYAIGLWYADFAQLADAEVCEYLEDAERRRSAQDAEVRELKKAV